MANQKIDATFRTKTKAMLLCYCVFVILYMSAKYIALYRDVSYSYVMQLDLYVPFWEWMIVPYATSAPFFVLVFYWTATQHELTVLTKRMLLVTCVAFVCFVVLPIGYSGVKPEIRNPILQYGFDFIATWDSKYNQMPSLHVAYGIVFLSVIYTRFKSVLRLVLMTWIVLVCVSTIFIFQHHIIDIFGAIVLCLIVFYSIPNTQNPLYANTKTALVYFMITTLLVFVACVLLNWISGVVLWLSLNTGYVGWSYLTTHAFFVKDEDGNCSLINRVLFAPYLVTYKILWQINQWYAPVKPFELLQGFYVGSYLNEQQAKEVFPNQEILVIDLSAELIENTYFKNNCTYYFLPSLDISVVPQIELNQTITRILDLYRTKSANTTLYLHCAMGYSRSMFIAKYVYMQEMQVTEDEAIAVIKQHNKYARFRVKK